VYKPAFSLEETTRIICEGRGSHFDPAVVDAFLARRDEFADIAARLADPEPAGGEAA
jgi:putative two-component system response regulator